jgi:hypothetical protein
MSPPRSPTDQRTHVHRVPVMKLALLCLVMDEGDFRQRSLP